MPSLSKIVRAAIYPGIGVARVGDSPDEYFIGPEVAFPANPDGGFRDASGALKRQAARFRVFGLDKNGKVVAELTARDADIRWTVHLANKKAAWYQFDCALDLPEAVPAKRRNANIRTKRERLVIDPGPRSVAGRRAGDAVFDSGRFFDVPVTLGELRTDDEGRLIVLGGRGVSGTPFKRTPLTTFANNDGWHDDASDGPVTAEVTLGGRRLPVEPAWVVVGPPNYAPHILSLEPMYAVMYQASAEPREKHIDKPSFTDHILPLLQRLSGLSWVNYGFHIVFGHGASYDFYNEAFVGRLATPSKQHAELRNHLYSMFRDPAATIPDAHAWPLYYGDLPIQPISPRNEMAITATQYRFLHRWAQGKFVADYERHFKPPAHAIEDVPLRDQPAALDFAAMSFCLGGPYHPGCEMTWPMRRPSMYSGPFRLRHRPANRPERDYGNELTPGRAFGKDGPLTCSGPGDLSRWLAVPWQADTASCRAGYITSIDAYLPTFWPARVPNHVLTEEDYKTTTDERAAKESRLDAFNRRATWYRWLDGSMVDQMTQMVTEFHRMGLIERQPGVPGEPGLPETMFVESTPRYSHTVHPDRNLRTNDTHKLHRFHEIRKQRGYA